jgi:hypothetical protein
MRSDNVQILALAGVLVAAMIIAAISWSLIPDSQPVKADNVSTPAVIANDTINNTDSMQAPANNTSSYDWESRISDNASGSPSAAPDSGPSSVVKWTDHKDGSELTPEGTAVWSQVITSKADLMIGYHRLSWDNVFYDNMYGGGNMMLQISWAFTDGKQRRLPA